MDILSFVSQQSLKQILSSDLPEVLMEVFENAQSWSEDFNNGWLAHLNSTGQDDWKQYSYVRNRTAINGPGVDPASSRLMLVSTAGAFIRDDQNPFDAASKYGDYSIRNIPSNTPLDELDYAHEHYDHTARLKDPKVNLPLDYLKEMVADGQLGELTRSMVSFSGYQPDAYEVVQTMIPEILRVAEKEGVQAALLVPV